MATSARKRKDGLYGGLAAVVKALGNPHRLELLDLLTQAPRTVEVLANMSSLSVANASQHLQVLRVAGLVDAEKVGAFVTYRVADPQVSGAVVAMRALSASRAAALTKTATALKKGALDAESIDRAALLARVRRGEVVVLDVRPAEEFAHGHIPGARSIPIGELKARIAELPRDREIVAYCRGPFCVFADDAVAMLSKAGLRAVRMSDGVAEWRAQGLPLANEVVA